MAHRLLPFRQYDENDVVNLFALNVGGGTNLLSTKPDVDGDNADGVLVKVENGNMNENDVVVNTAEHGQFMNSYNSPVGRNPYPTNPLTLVPATTGAATLGVTLMQTLSIDENNESLQFNPVKKDELQAVLSGQTVPVLTKGLITVTEKAVTKVGASAIAVGSRLASKQGKFIEAKADDNNPIGVCIGTGMRGLNHNDPTYGAIQPDFQSGRYYLIKLSC